MSLWDGTVVRRFRSATSRLIYRTLLALPESTVAGIEEKARLAQGKGGGAETLIQEVQAGLSLLPEPYKHSPDVFDVGAHVGKWTRALLDLRPSASVTCFEPSRRAFSELMENPSGYQQCELVQMAVSGSAGPRVLWSDQEGSALASLTQRALGEPGSMFSHSESINAITLDEWCRTANRYPNLLKLDVEGHEMEVLRGGQETLRHVSVVQFEFGSPNIDSRTFFRDYYRVNAD